MIQSLSHLQSPQLHITSSAFYYSNHCGPGGLLPRTNQRIFALLLILHFGKPPYGSIQEFVPLPEILWPSDVAARYPTRITGLLFDNCFDEFLEILITPLPSDSFRGSGSLPIEIGWSGKPFIKKQLLVLMTDGNAKIWSEARNISTNAFTSEW